MCPEVEAEAARIQSEVERAAEVAAAEEVRAKPVAGPHRVVWREDYVPKEDEDPYLTRKADGVPHLYLADAGDRLAIWSPVEDGGLINPKGGYPA